MKILMINVVCGIRSTGRICTDLAEELEKRGHIVKIAYGREEVPEEYRKYAVKIGNDLDVKFHALGARLFDAAGLGSRGVTERFIRWVQRYDPDVIHLHNIHGYYLNYEVLFRYLRTCGKKIIWTLHDCWAFTGHSAYCDAVHCERWITGCDDCPNMKEYPISFIDRSKKNWLIKRNLMQGVCNLTIVTPSHWLAELVKKSFLAEYSVKVIHNGIDTSKFYPMENDFKEFYGVGKRFMILGVATAWDEMKGFSDYLRLAELLGDEFRVVLVGLSKRQKETLPPYVLGIERTNSVKELAYIYSAADLFVNLSYCENYPTVNLEAMACGTPVLTYKTGGSPETIAYQEDMIITQGEISTVAEKIRKYREANHNAVGMEVDRGRMDKTAAVIKYTEVITGGYWKYKNTKELIGKKIVLGAAAVWDKRKGLDDLILIGRKLPLSENQVIIVGVTDSQKKKIPKEIKAIVRTNSIEEMRKLYSVADVFVNPTYEDNYPTTNLEAMACKTPVITYSTGGSPECLQGCNGRVFPQGNKQEIIRFLMNEFATNSFAINEDDMKRLDKKRATDSYCRIIET